MALLVGALAAAEPFTNPADDPRLQQARALPSEQALPLYMELVRTYPQSAAVWYEFGTVLSDQAQWQEAIAAFEHAAAQDYKPARTHQHLGKAHAKLKQFELAEAEYRKALALDPQRVSAQFGLGAALFNQNKNAGALPIFEKLSTRLDAWGPAAREYLAQLYFDAGRYGEAASLARELLQAQPDDPAFHWLLARTLFKLREYPAALEEFRWTARNDPTRQTPARYYIGASLEGSGRPREAEAAYGRVERGDPLWFKAANEARENLAGRSFFFTLDESAGYETGIVSNDEIAPVQEKDGYNELYASVLGRVYRGNAMSLWLSLDHYALNYFELHQNDYSQEAARADLRIATGGFFKEISIAYRLGYAEFDYQPYQFDNTLNVEATRETGAERFQIGAFGSHTHYFRDFDPLSGPTAGIYGEYRRRLPKWDHALTLRLKSEYRLSEASSLERLSNRVALQYRAQVWKALYGQVRMQYRRDDYLETNIGGSHRTDHRLTGEVGFDAQLNRHLSINWNYLYESQDSRLEPQEYGRHQMSAGFTLRF